MTDYKRTKEYHTKMLAQALSELAAGAEKGAAIRSLMTTFGCSKSTAHRVVTKAVAVRRGDRDPNHWGGKRPGAGRPLKAGDSDATES